MNLKSLYAIALVVFCVSIPVAMSADKVVFLVRGYDRGLVFEKKDGPSDGDMARKYYVAYRKESGSIVMLARLMAVVWGAMLVFSIVMIRRGVAMPLRLEWIVAVACVVLLAVTIGPILIFGTRWPPRVL